MKQANTKLPWIQDLSFTLLTSLIFHMRQQCGHLIISYISDDTFCEQAFWNKQTLNLQEFRVYKTFHSHWWSVCWKFYVRQHYWHLIISLFSDNKFLWTSFMNLRSPSCFLELDCRMWKANGRFHWGEVIGLVFLVFKCNLINWIALEHCLLFRFLVHLKLKKQKKEVPGSRKRSPW